MPAVANILHRKTQKTKPEKRRDLGLVLFVFGVSLAGFLFFLIQIMNSYPFYDWINHHRSQLGVFSGLYGDVSYFPVPFKFFKFTQLFYIGVCSAFAGLFVRQLSAFPKVTGRAALSALGFALLVMGVMSAVVVFLQIDVLTRDYLPWGWYSWGNERVAYNTQFLGSRDNCAFLNYSQLLYISIATALAGFGLWNLETKKWVKAPRGKVAGGLFLAAIALLSVGIFLTFTGVEFERPNPSMTPTTFAVEGVFMVWAGGILLMSGIIAWSMKASELVTNRKAKRITT